MTITKDDIAPKFVNGVAVEMTDAEIQAKVDEWNAWNDKSAERKLEKIKEIRLQKLKETDYLSNSDVTMPDNIKTWRQSLRDIPVNHTDENAYDLLLARNDAGELTHSIWSKP
jgi:type I restriction-modification system DNA methylase subunit